MAMNDDIYFIFFHNTKVCLGFDRLWSSEQYVRELGTHHGAAPSIGKSGTKGLANECFRKGRTSHMSHMKRTCNLTVNRTRCDFFSLPDILCMLRSTFQESLCSERFTIL